MDVLVAISVFRPVIVNCPISAGMDFRKLLLRAFSAAKREASDGYLVCIDYSNLMRRLERRYFRRICSRLKDLQRRIVAEKKDKNLQNHPMEVRVIFLS